MNRIQQELLAFIECAKIYYKYRSAPLEYYHNWEFKKKPKTDLDYVVLYAEKLKKDNRLFKQQKKLIEVQLKSSSSLFKKILSGKDFKKKAREYLKGRLLI